MSLKVAKDTNKKTMKKWSVHMENGEWIGYVDETTEDNARLAALSKFGEKIGDKEFSVLER